MKNKHLLKVMKTEPLVTDLTDSIPASLMCRDFNTLSIQNGQCIIDSHHQSATIVKEHGPWDIQEQYNFEIRYGLSHPSG